MKRMKAVLFALTPLYPNGAPNKEKATIFRSYPTLSH